MKIAFTFILTLGSVFCLDISDDTLSELDKIFTVSTPKMRTSTELEEVTMSTERSLRYLHPCGEGPERGVKICVPYYQCNRRTNTIMEDGSIDGFNVIEVRGGARPSRCSDSLDVCCKIPNTTRSTSTEATFVFESSYNVPVAPVTVNKCGIRNVNGIDFKLTGDITNEAEFGEFPWMVAILKKDHNDTSFNQTSPACGGSLITPSVVLTAAHCIADFEPGDFKIRAGEWDTQTTKERLPYQEKDVANITIHPNFNPKTAFSDFALLYLEQPVDLGAHISTACLPAQGQIINSTGCFVTGWGKKAFGRAGKDPAILKKIELPIVEPSQCQAALRKTRLGEFFILDQSFVCAGGEQGKDACIGDGGSPLVCPDPENPTRYLQVGIVAWGIGCGEADIPGVYADVAKFRNWIDDELQRLNIDTSSYVISTLNEPRLTQLTALRFRLSCLSPSMWWALTFLVVVGFGGCQDLNQDTLADIDRIFTQAPLLEGLEEVPTTPPESKGYVPSCGEGEDRGKRLCVPYFQCDGTTKTVVQTGVVDGFGLIDISHPLEVCCNIPEGGLDTKQPLPEPTSSERPTVAVPTCGIRNDNGIDFKITGNNDNEAEYGEFPWMVALLKKTTTLPYNISNVRVRVGEWDTQTTRERLPYQERDVVNVIIHPEFHPKTVYNDFALLILDRPVDQAENVGTICLPRQSEIINSANCFVSGWGKNVFGKAGSYQVILKKITLPIVPVRQCQDKLRKTRLGEHFNLHSSFICAGGEEGKDACTGDGGSPSYVLIHKIPEDMSRLARCPGGIGCGELNVPGVYADVAKYRSWIDQQLQRLNIDTNSYA
ncbi:hypothetical protein NQ317_014308 [Molorchus minor]|uniref:Peptidase S1 domain-containing protein n=1 Tax=Molorchus minor TaxID=1323400 RepID=A0ABQ9JXC9_9CUCU|nr:hypothetical protein NQ317_014308 [Molorchus minor]